MSAFTVPVVDVAPYRDDARAADRPAVAAALGNACRTVGFVQVTGHGVPAAVIDGLAAAMDAFFAQAPDTKAAYRTPPRINRGYTPPRSKSLSRSLGIEQRMNDFFEAFNVGAEAAAYPGVDLPADDYAPNVWPAAAPGFDAAAFRSAVEAYLAEAGRVARTLTRVLADALGVPHAVFAARTDHSLDVLRMNNYALPEGLAVDADLTGMGEHTDYGILTVLWADRVAGLQVLGADGVWHDVAPAEGALLVNLGDLTARWTGDTWRSTLHRVRPPVVDGRVVRRRSAAFFHDGNIDAVIETLPGLGGTAYPPITVGEHIAAKLAGSRAGIPNPATGEETARVLAAADHPSGP